MDVLVMIISPLNSYALSMWWKVFDFQNWRSQYATWITHFIISCFVIFLFLFKFFVHLMSALQPCTTTYGQACTSTIPCPGSNAGSFISSGCPGGSSTQTAGYVCPDGNHCRWSGRGFCCRAHHWPRHDRSFQWRTLGACQAWRHLPGKKKKKTVRWLEHLRGGLVWLLLGQSELWKLQLVKEIKLKVIHFRTWIDHIGCLCIHIYVSMVF